MLRVSGRVAGASTGEVVSTSAAHPRAGRLAAWGGVVAATAAALCCAGAPIIVSVLAAAGLSFLRNDAILLPVIIIALAAALWGFWRGRQLHGVSSPLMVAIAGAVALLLGVVVLHGLVAKVAIGLGAVLLLVATVWNARLPQSCEIPPVPRG